MVRGCTNKCSYIRDKGIVCLDGCVGTTCYKHIGKKNWVICSGEGCDKWTFSRFGFCTMHGQKCFNERRNVRLRLDRSASFL
jgi:hypothetical protein